MQTPTRYVSPRYSLPKEVPSTQIHRCCARYTWRLTLYITPGIFIL